MRDLPKKELPKLTWKQKAVAVVATGVALVLGLGLKVAQILAEVVAVTALGALAGLIVGWVFELTVAPLPALWQIGALIAFATKVWKESK